MFQAKKLDDEIHRLSSELEEQDVYIESRRTEVVNLESLISQSREGFNSQRSQRDKLQDERKYEFSQNQILFPFPIFFSNHIFSNLKGL